MSKQTINVQDGFLYHSLKSGVPLGVEMLGGRRIEGRLKRFDRYALVIDVGDDREVLVYKHAIASVSTAGDAGG